MKYQVIQTELAAEVFAETAKEAVKKANLQLDRFSQTDDILAKPKKIGPDIWRVPICSIKVGEPVEANSPKEAVEKISRALGLFPDPALTAIPVF